MGVCLCPAVEELRKKAAILEDVLTGMRDCSISDDQIQG